MGVGVEVEVRIKCTWFMDGWYELMASVGL